MTLYEQILKERYNKTDEILDILQVFFMQAMSSGNYKLSTNQIIEFIKDKLMINLSYEELREVLDNIAVVEAVNDNEISLYDPESMEAMDSENELPEETPEEEQDDKEAEKEEQQQKDMIKSATDTALSDLEKSSKLQ